MFRDIIIFLAGAEFFHTLSHIILSYTVQLPVTIGTITLTPSLNLWATVINAIITVLLLWWASRLRR